MNTLLSTNTATEDITVEKIEQIKEAAAPTPRLRPTKTYSTSGVTVAPKGEVLRLKITLPPKRKPK